MISDRLAPVGEHRNQLVDRRQELRQAIEPSDPRAIVARVAKMFLRFPGSAGTANSEGLAAAYAADLSKFPLWAIDYGIGAVISASGHSASQFAPSSPVLQDAVRKVLFPIVDEISEISKVLEAEVYHENTPEERARMRDGFDKILGELKGNLEPYGRRQRRPDARDPRPDPPVRVATKPPPLSDEALALFHAKSPKQPDTGGME